MRKAGVEEEPEIVEVRSEEEARERRFLGSPSVHIDGVDVEPQARERDDFGMA